MDPGAQDTFDYWTKAKVDAAIPLDMVVYVDGPSRLRSRSLVVNNDPWSDPGQGGAIEDSAGRLLFSKKSGGGDFWCSATVIDDDGTVGRSLIVTAAHCVCDIATDQWYTNFLFIPNQDDGQADGSDDVCTNDPYGCWAMP